MPQEISLGPKAHEPKVPDPAPEACTIDCRYWKHDLTQ